MNRLNSVFELFLLFCAFCSIHSLSLRKDLNVERQANVAIDFDQRFQHKSVNSINAIPELKELSENTLNRVKRGSYKVKTKVKYNSHGGVTYKTKIKHKTTYRVGGGGAGMMIGAGIVGGVVGAGLMYHAGKYGKHSFKRHGHDLVMVANVPVVNFTFNATHGHYHDAHGHYLGSDGVYHDHVGHQIMHDARDHVPQYIREYVVNDHKRLRPVIRDGHLMIPMFRFYPFNGTHGIWEYSATSVALVAVGGRGASLPLQPNLLTFSVILLTVTVLSRKSLFL